MEIVAQTLRENGKIKSSLAQLNFLEVNPNPKVNLSSSKNRNVESNYP